MAVFTPVSSVELSRWLSTHRLGELLSLTPIASGIENTNYFVETSMGHSVLTLFEKLSPSELPYYLGLMQHLAQHGLPCPSPRLLGEGRLCSVLNGKPAALVSRLQGSSCPNPSPSQCAHLGTVLARLHLAAATYERPMANPRGASWRQITAKQIQPLLNPAQQHQLQTALAVAPDFDLNLPHGPIHGDLFRDNVLFDGDSVSGLIDFYFAGMDNWLYDLAIVANDWCMGPDARLDKLRLQTLVSAYTKARPVEQAEQAAWPGLLVSAALRFWLSRLQDLHQPRSSELLLPHDPTWFEAILRHHLEQSPSWPC